MREIRDGFFYNTDVDADLSFCQFARDNVSCIVLSK